MSNLIVHYSYTKSPCGEILLARTEAGITHINFQEGKRTLEPNKEWVRDDEPLSEAADQLRAYFDGSLEEFDLPLAPEGTQFQQRVWDALKTIPCGQTVSYADIAQRIGQPTAVRAVASANARNPLPIIIPCHRVIGSDGKLRGYAGGLTIKRALLDLEQATDNLAVTEKQLQFPA